MLAASFVVAACGGSAATTAPSTAPAATAAPGDTAAPADSAAPASAPAESQAAVTGAIVVSGSSTVEPISTGVAEALAAANPGFTYTVTGPGTGDGFKTFCAGETDISDASRKIKDEEAKVCADAGIEYVELKIAYDGISVLTSVNNNAVDLPLVPGPLRAHRPRVHGLRQVERCGRPRQGARVQHGHARRAARDHRPR